MDTKSTFENFDELHFSTQAKQYLKEAAGWARFLSLVGLISIGLLVVGVIGVFLFGAFSRISMGPFEGSLIILIYGLMALLYFFPLYYLYQFAGNAKRAVLFNDRSAMERCFSFLKSHYKFMGVLVIVLLAFYMVAIVLAIFGTLGSSF